MISHFLRKVSVCINVTEVHFTPILLREMTQNSCVVRNRKVCVISFKSHALHVTESEGNCNHINSLKEHQEFLTKMEISVISDKGFTMEVYGDFRF